MKTYYKNILLGVMLLLSVSCGREYLYLEPTDSISDDKVFESFVIAESALVGAYDQLSSFGFDGLYVPIMSDIVGEDIMINSVDNWNWFVPVYQMDVLPNYVYTNNPWSIGYKLIYDANKIIADAQLIPDASADQIDRLEGEARVIRAFAMLKLVQIYAPSYAEDNTAPSILLVTEPSGAQTSGFERAPLNEVYLQMESDLLSAINLLDNQNDPGFFDQRAAKAILARVYLNMGEWALASQYAREAREGLELVSTGGLFDGFNYRNSETIFTIAYTQEDNNTYLSIPSFYWPVSGYSSMRANDDFVNMFANQDARKSFFLRLDEIDPDRHLILKFNHNNSVGNAERIVIRASEMYLIEAECEAELGNSNLAQDLLHTIQTRANPLAPKSTSTGSQLVNEILIERRKELFGEGFRWNDLKRRMLPFNRTGDHWVKLNFSAQDADYFRLTYPIPQYEIDANAKIDETDQNVGY